MDFEAPVVEDLQQHGHVRERCRTEHPAEPDVDAAKHRIGEQCQGFVSTKITVLDIQGIVRVERSTYPCYKRASSKGHHLRPRHIDSQRHCHNFIVLDHGHGTTNT